MKLLATKTETCVIDRATIDGAHQSPTTMFILHPKANMEFPWSLAGVFPGGTKTNPPPTWKRNKFMGLLTDFRKEMQQTELHGSHLVHVEVPFNSLLLKHNTAQLRRVRKQRQHDRKERKTSPQDYPHRFCVPSPSNRRQSGAKRLWCWQRHRQNGAYSDRWSEWLSSKLGERTSNPATQHPSIDWRWIPS